MDGWQEQPGQMKIGRDALPSVAAPVTVRRNQAGVPGWNLPEWVKGFVTCPAEIFKNHS